MKNIIVILFLLGCSTIVFSQTKPVDKVHHTCAGTKADGTACKQIVKVKDAYCRFHKADKVVCGANTSKGTPCQMPVKDKGQRCWRHKS